MRQSERGSKANSRIEKLARRLDPAAFTVPLSPRFVMLMRRRAAFERAQERIAEVRTAQNRMRSLLRRKASLDAEVRDLEASLKRHAPAGHGVLSAATSTASHLSMNLAFASRAKPANDDRRRAPGRRRARALADCL